MEARFPPTSPSNRSQPIHSGRPPTDSEVGHIRQANRPGVAAIDCAGFPAVRPPAEVPSGTSAGIRRRRPTNQQPLVESFPAGDPAATEAASREVDASRRVRDQASKVVRWAEFQAGLGTDKNVMGDGSETVRSLRLDLQAPALAAYAYRIPLMPQHEQQAAVDHLIAEAGRLGSRYGTAVLNGALNAAAAGIDSLKAYSRARAEE